ncbi:hypothetical protein LTR85_001033 [Meristemomyces frigidus]|nr:hypothetical protein LTR85_001033 [Meristemomyces frigidus]
MAPTFVPSPDDCNPTADWSPNLFSVTESNLTLNGHLWVLQAPVLDIVYDWTYLPAAELFLYSAGNSTISGDWIQQKGHSQCIPSNRYHWGFSSLMLFSFCVATFLFACIVSVLHYSNERHSRASNYTQHFSLYRDALDLSLELRALGDGDVEKMSAKEVDDYVKRHKGLVHLETDLLLPSKVERRHARPKRNGGHGRPVYRQIKRLGDSLPGLRKKKGTTIDEEEIALHTTGSSQPVFEGT